MNFFEKFLFIIEFILHFSCISFFKRLFLEKDHFLKVFFEFVTILLLFYVLGVLGHNTCRILVSQPGTEPTAPALVDEILTTGLSENSLVLLFFDFYYQSDFSFINDLGGAFLC